MKGCVSLSGARWQVFIRDEAGSTGVEQGLLANLIDVAAIGGLSAAGSSLNTSFQNTATLISSSPPAQTGGTSTSSETGTSNNGKTGTGSNGSETADSGYTGTDSNSSGNSTTPTTPPFPSLTPGRSRGRMATGQQRERQRQRQEMHVIRRSTVLTVVGYFLTWPDTRRSVFSGYSTRLRTKPVGTISECAETAPYPAP
jgi:pilus assembly protein Flp/PilA